MIILFLKTERRVSSIILLGWRDSDVAFPIQSSPDVLANPCSARVDQT